MRKTIKETLSNPKVDYTSVEGDWKVLDADVDLRHKEATVKLEFFPTDQELKKDLKFNGADIFLVFVSEDRWGLNIDWDSFSFNTQNKLEDLVLRIQSRGWNSRKSREEAEGYLTKIGVLKGGHFVDANDKTKNKTKRSTKKTTKEELLKEAFAAGYKAGLKESLPPIVYIKKYTDSFFSDNIKDDTNFFDKLVTIITEATRLVKYAVEDGYTDHAGWVTDLVEEAIDEVGYDVGDIAEEYINHIKEHHEMDESDRNEAESMGMTDDEYIDWRFNDYPVLEDIGDVVCRIVSDMLGKRV